MTDRRTVLSMVASFTIFLLQGCLDTLPDNSDSVGDGNVENQGSGQRREVVTTYDEALIARNDATTARDEGITAFNERNYADAIEPLETALTGYEDAEDGFADAASLAAEIDEEPAADICETALDETALQRDATDAALSAARAAQEGADAEKVNGHIEQFRSLREDAEAITVADADAVASALGVD